MLTDNQSKLLAALQKLFPEGTRLRFLQGTEPDNRGGELHRILIDYAKDAINLRIPRAFIDDYRDGSASRQSELEEQLSKFIAVKLQTFQPNPGPRLRPVVAWTLAADTGTSLNAPAAKPE